MPLTQEALDEVAGLSEVMTVGEEFLPAAVKRKCEQIIANVDDIKPMEAADSYLFLKAHYN